MIESFNHKGLKRLFEDDDRKLLGQDLVERIAVLLGYLDNANTIKELDIPSLRLHPLKGDRKGFWSITAKR
jgi:toxin HigB-1